MTERAPFTERAGEAETALTAVPCSPPDGDVEQDPRVELGQLRRAMLTRPAIDMARGILMASFGLSADDAWSVLVSVSQNTNTKLHLVADELVAVAAGGEIPKQFRTAVAVTVTKLQEPHATADAAED
ncbi:ANTAR domain-containing protein [Streptomyces sp. NPDC057302]|uniref:ANTAR domain-containing protein n=1 Tax=Streptomyces sp. NPDC057302 TaxID=3346094 RepID=UPI00362D38FC